MNRETIRTLEDSGMGSWWFALNVYTDWWNHWPFEPDAHEPESPEPESIEPESFRRLDSITTEEPCVKS